MAFDQATRNRLSTFVTDARSLLSDEFTRQLQHEYGLDPRTGEVTELAKLGHLDDARRETATLLRETMEHYLAGCDGTGAKARKEVLDRIAREQAFTVLNRLCALRMAEARGLLIESVARGSQSKGFQLYGRLAGPALGETGDAYRAYLFSIFDEFAVDLPVLFDRFSPEGRLFPRQAKLLELLAEINHSEIDALWGEDETIGWIYQYFNSKEERKAMRDASSAPRNSRELAVRNQFFTPRYVVEFLTDNTLGRIWYEMTRGETALKEECGYLVRRPNEVFLQSGEAVPESREQEHLNQKELLRQPVYIPHRALKDPRDLKMLDPACGSMHFGLYAFDLFERIYEEAWEIEENRGPDALLRPEGLAPLHDTYADCEAFLRDVPRLIIERNIHGIDIDPRAVQIAGLSLWLRAQKSWEGREVKPQQRPQVQRANIVCAEPMPGEEELLEEFIGNHLSTTPEQRVLGQLFRRVVEAMTLAGEAGSLLKIEEEIGHAVQEAKEKWLADPQRAQVRLRLDGNAPAVATRAGTDVSDITSQVFWEKAEEHIYEALRLYAEGVQEGTNYQRRLFVRDAARGFAFVDVCRHRFDVVVMNPPFGLSQGRLYAYLNQEYPSSFIDLLASFVARAEDLAPSGYVGAITSRACMYTRTLLEWRTKHLSGRISALADLGIGVLDGAMVRSCAYVIPVNQSNIDGLFIDARRGDKKESKIHANLVAARNGNSECDSWYYRDSEYFRLVPQRRILYWLPQYFWRHLQTMPRIEPDAATIRAGLTTYDDFRFLRLRWEVSPAEIGVGGTWMLLSKGGSFGTFYNDVHLLVLWANEGIEVGEYNRSLYETDAQSRRGSTYYLRPAVTYSRRTDFFSARALPSNCFFADKGPAIVPLGETSPTYLLGVFNSDLFRGLVHSQSQGGCFETGVLKLLPWQQPSGHQVEVVEKAATAAWRAKSEVFATLETDARFVSPLAPQGRSIAECHSAAVSSIRRANSDAADRAAAISSEIAELFAIRSQDFEDLDVFETDHEIKETADLVESASLFAADVLSYLLGAAFGRWDIRCWRNAQPNSAVPDPFEPLPLCPPGQLQNPSGSPIVQQDMETLQARGSHEYPVQIPWGGILVDDLVSPLDVVSRIDQVATIAWEDRHDEFERDACEILGVRSLRIFFQKPGGFFAHHLKRYSRSRRQAPIYWPLSTPSGSYTLWLYYHRLTDQTLYTCVNDFVEPKLKQIGVELAALRTKPGRSTAEERELERLSNFEKELRDFGDELLRIVQFWKPDLSDGVQITAAPLWKLFQHKPWRKKLKGTWEKLEAGDYDWAHLAYAIRPERVREKCRTDKSLAIAHGLEDLYEEPTTAPKKKRRRRKQTP